MFFYTVLSSHFILHKDSTCFLCLLLESRVYGPNKRQNYIIFDGLLLNLFIISDTRCHFFDHHSKLYYFLRNRKEQQYMIKTMLTPPQNQHLQHQPPWNAGQQTEGTYNNSIKTQFNPIYIFLIKLTTDITKKAQTYISIYSRNLNKELFLL